MDFYCRIQSFHSPTKTCDLCFGPLNLGLKLPSSPEMDLEFVLRSLRLKPHGMEIYCQRPTFLSELPGKLKRWVLVVKSPPANAGDIEDVGSIPGWGRSPGGGNSNPL